MCPWHVAGARSGHIATGCRPTSWPTPPFGCWGTACASVAASPQQRRNLTELSPKSLSAPVFLNIFLPPTQADALLAGEALSRDNAAHKQAIVLLELLTRVMLKLDGVRCARSSVHILQECLSELLSKRPLTSRGQGFR